MVVPVIIGVLILLIVIYVAFRILKNLVFGLILIVVILFAAFLIFGSLPDLRSIPVIGQLIPRLPTSTGDAIAIIKNVFYNIDILGVTRDSASNLLITVANTGKLSVSELKVFIDNETARIINNPKDPLPSKETTIIQVDWKNLFKEITVQTKQVSANFKA